MRNYDCPWLGGFKSSRETTRWGEGGCWNVSIFDLCPMRRDKNSNKKY
jgi:hypothetical protein